MTPRSRSSAPAPPLIPARSLARLGTVALALLAAACSSTPPEPPAPPPLDPTGTFDIAMDLEGQVVDGVLVLEGSLEGGYTGNISAMGNSATMEGVVVDGDTVDFEINVDGVIVAFQVTYEDTGFTGVFEGMADGMVMGGTIIGTKR